MKKTILGVFIFIATLAAVFFVCAFILWEINPKLWPEHARAMVGVLGLFISGALTGLLLVDL